MRRSTCSRPRAFNEEVGKASVTASTNSGDSVTIDSTDTPEEAKEKLTEFIKRLDFYSLSWEPELDFSSAHTGVYTDIKVEISERKFFDKTKVFASLITRKAAKGDQHFY